MFFLNDLMPLAKSPISPLILLPPPNSTRITASTTNQCQMLKLPIIPPKLLPRARTAHANTHTPVHHPDAHPVTWRDSLNDASTVSRRSVPGGAPAGRQ